MNFHIHFHFLYFDIYFLSVYITWFYDTFSWLLQFVESIHWVKFNVQFNYLCSFTNLGLPLTYFMMISIWLMIFSISHAHHHKLWPTGIVDYSYIRTLGPRPIHYYSLPSRLLSNQVGPLPSLVIQMVHRIPFKVKKRKNS